MFPWAWALAAMAANSNDDPPRVRQPERLTDDPEVGQPVAGRRVLQDPPTWKGYPPPAALVTVSAAHRSPEESAERIRRAQEKRERRAAKRAAR